MALVTHKNPIPNIFLVFLTDRNCWYFTPVSHHILCPCLVLVCVRCLMMLMVLWLYPQSPPSDAHKGFYQSLVNAAVVAVNDASFPKPHFSPSAQFSTKMLEYSTLGIISLLMSSGLLVLSVFLKVVNNCLLDTCQVSSLHPDCTAHKSILRDH